jgi:glycosyltransferase involved in cell wall biosynthesis
MLADHHSSVSVAMCTYNGAAFLPQQLESILDQTRLPDEVVICDDGSEDETFEILQHWVQDAPFIVRLVRNEARKGVVGNFEHAISLCRGDLIVLSDQDDVWYRDKIATLVECFERDEAVDAVFSDAYLVDEDTRLLGRRLWEAARFSEDARRKVHDGNALDVILRYDVATGATMAFRSYRRSLLLPIPETAVHDGWIALVLSLVGRLDLIEKPLIAYRQHAGNVIGIRNGDLREQLRMAADTGRREYARLLDVLVQARDRVRDSGLAPPARIARLESRIAHTRARLGIAASRRPTLLPVLREALSGRYSRYGEGWKSALKDFVGSWTVYRRRD